MVDPTVNTHSSMEVILEAQTQLVSRIGLATKSSNKLSFLHGKIGVGKSHVAHLIQHGLDNTQVVKIQLKQAIEPEQLKQQIICELATDELSDLNQPIATAVHNGIVHNNQSILLIIDNAEHIPQQILSALWQSIHEFTRMNQSHCTFNILLIGDTRWAIPMHHGLKNKTDSLVAEFEVLSLTKSQATDFMMSIHTDWSDLKIQQFINKVAPEYLIPKQLIYAQLPQANGAKRKVILFVGAIFTFLCILTAIVGYLMANEKERSNKAEVEIPQVVSPLLPVELVKLDDNKTLKPQEKDKDIESTDSIETPTVVVNEVVSEKLDDDVTPLSSEDNTSQSKEAIVAQTVEAVTVKPINISTDDTATRAGVVDNEVSSFKFDEAYLLALSQEGYSLMLGGFSNEATLLAVKERFTQSQQLKMYKTNRYGASWFVLLYGSFDTLSHANQFVQDNASVFEAFSPWGKSHRAIQQEINASQLLENNKKEDND